MGMKYGIVREALRRADCAQSDAEAAYEEACRHPSIDSKNYFFVKAQKATALRMEYIDIRERFENGE